MKLTQATVKQIEKEVGSTDKPSLLYQIDYKGNSFMVRFIAPYSDDAKGFGRVEVYWNSLGGSFCNIEIYTPRQAFGKMDSSKIQTSSYGSLDVETYEYYLPAQELALEIARMLDKLYLKNA
ncbi:MAG: hypothetical protein WC783_03025 [Candidatus Paceibacterota bacterium]|jgi:hypothetical protein